MKHFIVLQLCGSFTAAPQEPGVGKGLRRVFQGNLGRASSPTLECIPQGGSLPSAGRTGKAAGWPRAGGERRAGCVDSGPVTARARQGGCVLEVLPPSSSGPSCLRGGLWVPGASRGGPAVCPSAPATRPGTSVFRLFLSSKGFRLCHGLYAVTVYYFFIACYFCCK